MENLTGKFVWNELMTHDAEQAKAFCAKSYGWTYDSMPGANGITYWICKADGVAIGGIFEMKGTAFDGMPDHWMPYVAVDNVDATYKTAIGAGATSCREPFEISNVGRIAIYNEPGGAMIGIIKPLPMRVNVPGSGVAYTNSCALAGFDLFTSVRMLN